MEPTTPASRPHVEEVETVELTARHDPLALALALLRTAAQITSAIALVVIAADIV